MCIHALIINLLCITCLHLNKHIWRHMKGPSYIGHLIVKATVHHICGCINN